ncbi:hypothetical protein NX85_23440, partial [Aeromonas salmonicida subsp. salmonicida]
YSHYHPTAESGGTFNSFVMFDPQHATKTPEKWEACKKVGMEHNQSILQKHQSDAERTVKTGVCVGPRLGITEG